MVRACGVQKSIRRTHLLSLNSTRQTWVLWLHSSQHQAAERSVGRTRVLHCAYFDWWSMSWQNKGKVFQLNFHDLYKLTTDFCIKCLTISHITFSTLCIFSTHLDAGYSASCGQKKLRLMKWNKINLILNKSLQNYNKRNIFCKKKIKWSRNKNSSASKAKQTERAAAKRWWTFSLRHQNSNRQWESIGREGLCTQKSVSVNKRALALRALFVRAPRQWTIFPLRVPSARHF